MISLPDPFKRGATFRLPFDVTDANDQPTPVPGWLFSSHMRNSGGDLLQDFQVRVLDVDQGMVEFFATPGETALWPLGHHFLDIRVQDGSGDVYLTATIQVKVEEGVTRAGP